MTMGVFDSCADRQKQSQSLLDTKLLFVGVFRNPGALNVLHHEVRSSILGGAAIEQPCDVRMLQSSKDLTFSLEAAMDEVRIKTRMHQFNCNVRLILLVVPRSQINGPHRSEEHTSELQSLRHLVCR